MCVLEICVSETKNGGILCMREEMSQVSNRIFDPLLIVRDPYTQEKPEKKNYRDALFRTPTLSPTSLLFPFCKHGSTP